MDDSALERIASRVAGGSAPDPDPVYELERLIIECRQAMGLIVAGVVEGRLSEDAMRGPQKSMEEKARSACESFRSCKNEMEAVLPRSVPGRVPATKDSVTT